MNDIYDAVSTRLKAPYFGYALLAFLAMNWRSVFLLAATEGSPQERLAAFDAGTSFQTLIFYPLSVAAIALIAAPWLRLAFGFLSRKPHEFIELLSVGSEHKILIRKTQLEHARSGFFAEKEVELINMAKRDEEVRKIENTQLRGDLENEIESLRRERERMSKTIDGQKNRVALSTVETEILKAAAESGDGSISRDIFLGGRRISIGGQLFGEQNDREFAKYDSALNSLLSKDLVQTVGKAGQLFELTHSGWLAADTL